MGKILGNTFGGNDFPAFFSDEDRENLLSLNENKKIGKDKKKVSTKTTFSNPPTTVEEAKNKEKRHWRLAP
ncbi:MAG: hypothetical protein NT161_03300 [Candidatus Nomurabacteria bacterium]|nr:hypothetical protein [Candidatus Nomurabacteria bacterium]